MIVSTAPGRCGLVGNPTDMYGGTVISCSTVERARCVLSESSHLIVAVERYSQEIESIDDLKTTGSHLDIIKAVLTYFELGPTSFRFRLHATTDIPERAGLAGSTAMLVAVLGCTAAQLGLSLDPYILAETARKIECNIMGICCGYQDQHMAVFGGMNYMDFRGKEKLLQDDGEPLATVEPLGHLVNDIPIVVAHTGITRNSGSVHKSIRERWCEGEISVIDGYKRIAELARLGKTALLTHDWETLGELMNENHSIQRMLGGSGPQNDYLIETALANGALGAKLAGAGLGGTIVALTLEPDRTVHALRKAGAEDIIWPRPLEGLSVESTKSVLNYEF